jgi:hypothetical protein
VLAQVPPGVYRSAADTAVTMVFSGLRQSGFGLLAAGCLMAAVAYLAGPGRLPSWVRRRATDSGGQLRRVARRAGAASPAWIRRHVDLLRVAGVIVAAVIASVLSSWTGLLVVALVLGAYELVLTFVGPAGGAARRRPGPEAAHRAREDRQPSGP